MSTLVKKEITKKRNIARLKTFALSKNHCRQLKGGGDGVIVQDVVIH